MDNVCCNSKQDGKKEKKHGGEGEVGRYQVNTKVNIESILLPNLEFIKSITRALDDCCSLPTAISQQQHTYGVRVAYRSRQQTQWVLREQLHTAVLNAAPEGVEVVELHPLHEVERVLKLFLGLAREANDDVSGDSRVGCQLRTDGMQSREETRVRTRSSQLLFLEPCYCSTAGIGTALSQIIRTV